MMNKKYRLVKYAELLCKMKKGVKETAKSTSHLKVNHYNQGSIIPRLK